MFDAIQNTLNFIKSNNVNEKVLFVRGPVGSGKTLFLL